MAKKYVGHYDNTKLINSLDADGERPAFYIVCSRERGPGKSFSFSKLLFEHFLDNGEKFILLTRRKKDLGSVAEGMFEGYFQIEHPEYNLREVLQMGHTFSNIYADTTVGEEKSSAHCVWVIPIASCDDIKKISSLFMEATAFYFDEFQPMDDRYLRDEVDLVRTIYKSVARGDGKAVRYMPIYMASNTITLQNPYFKALGLSNKIQSNTKFYRGEGVVFENCEVEGLKEMHSASPIDKALKKHLDIKRDNTWLNDDNSLVAKPKGWGRPRYIATIIYGSESFGVLEYPDVLYISRTVDTSCEYVYNLTFDNGNLNIALIDSSSLMEFVTRQYYLGKVRVQDGGIQRILQEVL